MEKCSSGKEGKKNPTILDGKYELGRLLGYGTFAKVYHAQNLASGKSVAIKAVGKEKILKVGMMEQIKREIAVMKMVKHSNIVDLHEVMATKSKIYFAMEFVKGGELFAKVARGKLREDTARTYFQQLISAVDFCHSRGVYHRDLKLENLLLDEHGDLKVTDFGLSALSDHIRPDVGLLHTTCGTPAYVAPEVLAKRGYDGAKADLWSCGVILYVLLAGFLPFQDNNVVAMYQKIYRGDFKCPPWFSSEARRLILKLLDPNPNTRITMDKLMEAPWFKKQSALPPPPSKTVAFEAEDDLCRSGESLNAFDIISLSQGFDLSPLFEGKKKAREELRFTAKESASNVMSKLEDLAKAARFSVKRSETKVKMQGPLDNGRKGHLAISAEVFAVAPSFVVVEMKKSFGDTLDYHRFCADDLRPALGDIVWAWQGESPTTATLILTSSVKKRTTMRDDDDDATTTKREEDGG